MLSRRETLGIAMVAGLGAAAGCGRAPVTEASKPVTPSPKATPEDRLLSRIGFGPTDASRTEVANLGLEKYIDQQLAGPPANLKDQAQFAFRLRHLEAFEIEAGELGDQPEGEIMRQLQAAALIRATYSDWGLQERMVDFWTNHFNVYGRKGLAAYRLPKDQLEVIRKNALGSFPTMLHASAHSAAMLMYLDNQVNVAGVPNENYARELMELHTLGVHGGYSQSDVREVARCFTGWAVEDRLLRPRGRFRFREDLHDKGAKVVLGKTIYHGDKRDGDEVLKMLAAHPNTAKFIAGKLCRYFLGDRGHGVIPVVTEQYLATNGDIRSMLTPILKSPLMLKGQGVVRRPFDYTVACLRATGADTDGGRALHEHVRAMGQPLHEWPMPDGYPDRTSAWTGSLLARWNFAMALCANEISGTKVRPEAQDLALTLAGPAFQWR